MSFYKLYKLYTQRKEILTFFRIDDRNPSLFVYTVYYSQCFFNDKTENEELKDCSIRS